VPSSPPRGSRCFPDGTDEFAPVPPTRSQVLDPQRSGLAADAGPSYERRVADAVAIIERAAAEAGLGVVGATPIVPTGRDAFLASWLAEGRAGEMRWLERRTEIRLDPRRQFPWANSLLVVAAPYAPAPPPPGDWRDTLRGRIAAYAFGPDYHRELGHRLDAMAAKLREHYPTHRFLSYVDTGAILEREWAWRAGLGWIGKHTLLLSSERGSWTLLGELVTSLEVEGRSTSNAAGCGSCRRCVVACPTDALAGDYSMDPRRCLSYLTIEHRSALPRELRASLENWIFGCDLCQEACPWGPDASIGSRDEATMWLHPSLPELMELDDDAFAARFDGTAVSRAKRTGLLRNVAVALGNSGNPDAVPVLARAMDDPEPLIRGHAAWALGRLGGSRARQALDDARRHEPDETVLDEIAAALQASG